ncbi:MAG: AAA family ATPase [Acidobacteria bacterium]|nr:AAA family ATPase [Acidobacteriota bacterium]
MKLIAARIQNYRSARDTGWFQIEQGKTILVGPNEAGKTVILEALRRLKAPSGVPGFKALRDYPRSSYNTDIQSKKRNPAEIPVVTGRFSLDEDDVAAIGEEYRGASFVVTRFLDRSAQSSFEGGPEDAVYTDAVRKSLRRMAAHIDLRRREQEVESGDDSARQDLDAILADWKIGKTTVSHDRAEALKQWLEDIESEVDEQNQSEERRHTELLSLVGTASARRDALTTLYKRMPVFVYFEDYFRIRPNLHLGHLADRVDQGLLDDDRYDYGNLCLLRLLGFTPRQLSDLGNVTLGSDDDDEGFEQYREPLDERDLQLNAASLELTKAIQSAWQPNATKSEADTLRIKADGQYLKVVVEDELGVEVELDQRSAGFRWLVSFFVVFFAESREKYANAILLLDEPGLSLHGLKQRDFRSTVSRLAETNQTLYTTHSPFLVGPDELALVRVVEMRDRNKGTVVHEGVTGGSPVALLPLQEALGYDLGQSLFMQKRTLVLEGITDYFYFEAASRLITQSGIAKLDDNIALVPAGSAGKVVYFATILHANRLKVAALLDSDRAGENAAKQDTLVHTLKNRNILRTADYCEAHVAHSEIEDLVRDTLIAIARDSFECDVEETANQQVNRSISSILEERIPGFSKYRMAKLFVAWTRDHAAEDLSERERAAWRGLIAAVNRALR